MPSKQDSDKDKQPSKAPKNGRYNTRKKTRKKNKKVNYKLSAESDDSDSDWLPPEERPTSDHDDNDSMVQEGPPPPIEVQRLMQKLFPSKSGKKRLSKLEKMNQLIKQQEQADKKAALCLLKLNNARSPMKDEKTESTPIETVDDEEDSDDDYEDINGDVIEDEEDLIEDEEFRDMFGQNMHFNIIFTVGERPSEDIPLLEDDGEDLSSDDEAPSSAARDTESTKEVVDKVSCETKESKTKPNQSLYKFKVKDRVIIQPPHWEEPYTGIITRIRTRNRYDIRLDDDELEQRDWKLIRRKYIKPYGEKEIKEEEIISELETLVKLRRTKGVDAAMKKLNQLADAAERKEKKLSEMKTKKLKRRNTTRFKKLFRTKNTMNDLQYFQEKLDLGTQKKIIRELKAVNKFLNVEKPYRLTLLESKIPLAFKAAALKKINILNYMDPGSGEYYKIKQWVDGFMQIPFEEHTTLPVKISDGKDKCSDFLEDAKQILDECVYGLNDAKMQIMQLMGQLISNPNSIGSAIAIKGPPGTGKTTLIKEGISKILKRPFAFLALGGATDSSFLEGHSYTYEGSSWGKIVDIVIQSKTMNPVIYFDELDKVSDTPKGEEITGILTHLTDTTQNNQFHDKYFSSIYFDLSKALFIFSYNDEEKINPILKDRMYQINTKGYKTGEKQVIAKKHLIPDIEKNINFKNGDVVISDEVMSYIITKYTNDEKGVRNLKRCLEILYTKINLYKLMKQNSKLFNDQEVLKIEYPFTITESIVNKLIKKNDDNTIPFGMYV